MGKSVMRSARDRVFVTSGRALPLTLITGVNPPLRETCHD